jgi:SAM-dependent methyltransferase
MSTVSTEQTEPHEFGFNAKQGVNWSDYVIFRPIYPPSFFNRIFTYHSSSTNNLETTWTTAHDVGAGCGIAASSLASHFKKVIVSDPNEGYTTLAQKVLIQELGHPESKFSFLQESAEKSSVESGTVDLITVCECIHWMRPEVAIPEFARQLRVGGTLVITHYNHPRIEGNELAQRAWDAIRDVYVGAVGNPMFEHALRIMNSGFECLGFPIGAWEGVRRLYVNALGRIETFRLDDRVGESLVHEEEEVVWEEGDEGWMDEQGFDWFRGYLATWAKPDVPEEELKPYWDQLERAMDGKKVRTATPLVMVFATKRA